MTGGRKGVMPLMFQERMRRVEDELGGRWVEGWVVARGFEGREGRGGVERRRVRGGGEREDERSCKFISGCGRWCATPALSARATKVKISSKKWGPTSPRFPLRPSRCLLQGPPHHHPNNLPIRNFIASILYRRKNFTLPATLF